MTASPSSGSAEKRKRVPVRETEEKQRIVKDSKKKDKKRKVQRDTQKPREEEDKTQVISNDFCYANPSFYWRCIEND